MKKHVQILVTIKIFLMDEFSKIKFTLQQFKK